jgi:hypothetical protein
MALRIVEALEAARQIPVTQGGRLRAALKDNFTRHRRAGRREALPFWRLL